MEPYVPKSPGIDNYRARKEYASSIQQRRIAEQQKQLQKEQLSLLKRTEYPVQINPRVSATMQDRWAIIGMSGSGKTTWAKEFIPRMLAWYAIPIIIFDTKGQGEFDDMATELHIKQEPPSPLQTPGIQVWRPPLDDIDSYDQMCTRILKNRIPALVIIDELSNLGKGNPDTYPNGYKLLLKQGRGLYISTVSMVQEAAYIPRQTTGQTSHLMRFHLLNDYDKLKMARMMGLPDEMKYTDPPDEHGFYYRRMDKPSPVIYYWGWQEFFPRVKRITKE